MEQHRRINLAYILNKSDDLLSPDPNIVKIYHVHPADMTPEEVCSFVESMTIVGIKNLDMTDVKVKFERPYHEYDFFHEYGLTEMFQRVYEEYLSAKRQQEGPSKERTEHNGNPALKNPTGSVQFYWKAEYAGGDTMTFLYRKAIDKVLSERVPNPVAPAEAPQEEQEEINPAADLPLVDPSSNTEAEEEDGTSAVTVEAKEEESEGDTNMLIKDKFLHLVLEETDTMTTAVNLEEKYGMVRNIEGEEGQD